MQLRASVTAIDVPGGVLLHDPLRWRLFHLPETARAPEKFLAQHGLDAASPEPPAAPRLQQIFWLRRALLPSQELHIDPAARFGCVCCGKSCRDMLLGPLRPQDAQRLVQLEPQVAFIDSSRRPAELDSELPLFLGKSDDGCQFLRPDGLCGIHARYGAEAKPLFCRTFPLMFCATPDGVVAGMRLGECLSAELSSQGPLLDEREVRPLYEGLDEVPYVPPTFWLTSQSRIGWREYLQREAAVLAEPTPQRIFATFDPSPPPPAPREELEALGGGALPQSGPLERALLRQAVLNKDLFRAPDLATGAARLVVTAWLARRAGVPLNEAWAAAATQGFAEGLRGLDLRALAARSLLA